MNNIEETKKDRRKKTVVRTNIKGRTYETRTHLHLTFHRMTEDSNGNVKDDEISGDTFMEEVDKFGVRSKNCKSFT